MQDGKQRFFQIAILFSLAMLAWLALTPSLSAETILGRYSLARFIVMIGFCLFILLLVLGLVFSRSKGFSNTFEKILGAKVTFLVSLAVASLMLLLIAGSLLNLFQGLNTLVLRFIPLPLLAFLLCLEILIYQEIASRGELRKSIKFLRVEELSREQKTAFLSLIIFIGFFTAVCFHYVQGVYKGLGYPHNTFLFEPWDRFNDFFNPLKGSFDRDPYNPERISFIGGYLPFGYCVSFLFSLVHPWQLSCGIFIVLFIVFLWQFIRKCLYDRQKIHISEVINLLILTALTYPVLFILDRTNFDIVVFIFIALFALYYQKGKKTLAVILLAIPIAMKGYPLVLLTIPLLEKRFKDIAITGSLVVLLEAFSLAIFKDGLILEFSKMMTSFGTAFSIAFDAGALIRFNSSLYTFLLFLWPSLSDTTWFSKVYFFTALLLFGGVAWTMFKQKFPFWKNLFLITLIMILFPQSSGDYRLVMLFPPLMFFLTAEEHSKLDVLIIFLSGLILIPKAYYIFYTDVNLGIVVNPLLLFSLLVFLLVTNFKKTNQLLKT